MKKNNNELIKLYGLVTQYFIIILTLIGVGYFIGYKINKESVLPAILAIVGGLSGIVTMIIQLLKLNLGGEKKNE